mmetsp:Transcript_18022/g.46168  ORF Transcript_18022/g.46168 Transcript_18022/m.46168 type:complete len:305 (+) Transcript_18022:240-1154(+)
MRLGGIPGAARRVPRAAHRRRRRLHRGRAPLAAGRRHRGRTPVARGASDGRRRSVPVGGRRLRRNLDGHLARRLLLLGLLLHLLRVAVEEEVDHHVPRLRAGDRAAQAQHLAREHPVEEADRVLALVVGRDRDVDVLKRRVGVAERDRRDVGVRRLGDRLVVGARVGEQQQARLHKLVGDLVGEGTRGEAAGDRRGARVLAVLEDRALAVRARRDDAHVTRVLDRNDDARGKQELVVGAAEVDDVDAVRLALPDVTRHLVVQVLGAEVRRARQHHLEVLLLLLLGDTAHHDHGCGVSLAAGVAC